MGKKHTLALAGRYEFVQQLCQFAAKGALQAGLDDTAVFHVELACDEACTNIIEHAYGEEGIGDIVISWQVDDNQFVITIQDNGRSFDPEDVPVPATVADPNSIDEASTDSLQVGGLGVHFIRKLMDDVQVVSDEQGNRLTMMKKIESG